AYRWRLEQVQDSSYVIIIDVRDDEEVDVERTVPEPFFDVRSQDADAFGPAVDHKVMRVGAGTIGDPEAISLSGGEHGQFQHASPSYYPVRVAESDHG